MHDHINYIYMQSLGWEYMYQEIFTETVSNRTWHEWKVGF